MLALIQRVSEAAVVVEGRNVGEIGCGLVVLLGVQKGDVAASVDKLLSKILAYRVFPDDNGHMNVSLSDVGGGLLLVSQFTLAADTKKGLRPSFSSAAPPQEAQILYDAFVDLARSRHPKVETGIFGADMKVRLINDGPVTFLLEA